MITAQETLLQSALCLILRQRLSLRRRCRLCFRNTNRPHPGGAPPPLLARLAHANEVLHDAGQQRALPAARLVHEREWYGAARRRLELRPDLM